MRTFGKIEGGFWTNPRVRALDIQSRELLVYLFTCSHSNLAGCYVLPLLYVMEDLRLDEAKARLHLKHLVASGFIERNEETGLTRITGWWGHNSIENERVAGAVVRTLRKLPDDVVRLHAYGDIRRQLGTRKFSDKVQAALANLLPALKKTRRRRKAEPVNGEFSFANGSDSRARPRAHEPEPEPIDQTSYPEPRARKPRAPKPSPAPRHGSGPKPSHVNGSRLGRAAQPPDRIQEITPIVVTAYGPTEGLRMVALYQAGDDETVAKIDQLMEAQA